MRLLKFRPVKSMLLPALVLAAVLAGAWGALAQAQRAPQKAPAKAPAAQPSQPSQKPPAAQQAPAARPGAAGQPSAQGKPAAGGATDTMGAAPPDTGNIDEILEGEEEVLSGSGFSYDPGNRRDPFKSLLAKTDSPAFRGPRPEGVPGLLIEEIDLTGIFRTSKGFVAQVVAANQKKSYLLKEGDQLYDGDVVSINKNEVVFKQIVQDPTALKPFREVVKSLNPS